MDRKKRKTAWGIQLALAVCNVILFYKAYWLSLDQFSEKVDNIFPLVILMLPVYCLFGAAIEAGLLIISHHRITSVKAVLKQPLFWLLQAVMTILAGFYLISAARSWNYYDVGFCIGCWGFMEIFLWMLK